MPSSASAADTIAIPELKNVRGNPQWSFAGIEEPGDEIQDTQNTTQSILEKRVQKKSEISRKEQESSTTPTGSDAIVVGHQVGVKSANNLPPTENHFEDLGTEEIIEVERPSLQLEPQQGQSGTHHRRRYLSRLMAQIWPGTGLMPFFPIPPPPQAQQAQQQKSMIIMRPDGGLIIIPMPGGGGGGAANNDGPKWVELDMSKLGDGANGNNGGGNTYNIENMNVYHLGNA